jgi:hypothetical protein
VLNNPRRRVKNALEVPRRNETYPTQAPDKLAPR